MGCQGVRGLLPARHVLSRGQLLEVTAPVPRSCRYGGCCPPHAVAAVRDGPTDSAAGTTVAGGGG